MLRGTYWTIISLLLLIFLSVNIEGNRRREKPSRWKEVVDNENEGTMASRFNGVDYRSRIVGNQGKSYPYTFKFTYSSKYDESCDCQRSVPSNVKGAHRDEETLDPPVKPLDLYLSILRSMEYDFAGLSPMDRSSTKLQNLRILLRGHDERGALMLISSDNHPICDDELNDRTAIALCQLHGFKTGRRTSMSLKSRDKILNEIRQDKAELLSEFDLVRNGNKYYDPRMFHCFRAASITHHPRQAYNNLGKDSTNTTLGTQILNATDNISIADTCSLLTESHIIPCSRNQGAAVFCHNNDPPFLQFYNIEIHVGLTKFYITFNARYVKLGRIYEYFDFPKSNDVMPKRSDFSATMCGRKVPLDLETTREMGKGRHLVFLGKFLKKCEECVWLKFKHIFIIVGDEPFICKLKGDRTKENENNDKKSKSTK